jgi:hypothetical protein
LAHGPSNHGRHNDKGKSSYIIHLACDDLGDHREQQHETHSFGGTFRYADTKDVADALPVAERSVKSMSCSKSVADDAERWLELVTEKHPIWKGRANHSSSFPVFGRGYIVD